MIQDAYDKLEEAWRKAEAVLHEMKCPYDARIELVPDINLVWTKLDKGWRICIEYVSENEGEVPLYTPITDVKVNDRIFAIRGFEKLKREVLTLVGKAERDMFEAADSLERIIEQCP